MQYAVADLFLDNYRMKLTYDYVTTMKISTFIYLFTVLLLLHHTQNIYIQGRIKQSNQQEKHKV